MSGKKEQGKLQHNKLYAPFQEPLRSLKPPETLLVLFTSASYIPSDPWQVTLRLLRKQLQAVLYVSDQSCNTLIKIDKKHRED